MSKILETLSIQWRALAKQVSAKQVSVKQVSQNLDADKTIPLLEEANQPFWMKLIWQNLGLDKDSPLILHLLIQSLFESALQGYPYLELDSWYEQQLQALGVTPLEPVFTSPPWKAIKTELIVWIETRQELLWDGWLYVRSYWELERSVQAQFTRLTQPSQSVSSGTLNVDSSFLSGLNEEQRKALFASLASPFLIVAGGPGTGKTYTAARIVQALSLHLQSSYAKTASTLKIALLAPTGKAAVRLEDSFRRLLSTHSDQDALAKSIYPMTLHRFLIMGMREGGYHHQLNPAPYDIILVDEVSMLDMTLFNHLLSSVHQKTHLILMGDPDQLPPVEGPSPLASMLEQSLGSKSVHPLGISLVTCLRTENVELLQAARAVRDANYEEFQNLLNRSPWITFKESPSRYLTKTDVEELLPLRLQLVPSLNEAFDLLEKEVILCTSRLGPWGSQSVNEKVYQVLREKALEKGWPHLDLPLMATVNQPQVESVNGQMGMIRIAASLLRRCNRLSMAIERVSCVYYRLPGMAEPVAVACVRLESLEPAWAMTVHKSQGSEFNRVTLLLAPGAEKWGRSLLYTAFTRARQSVVLLGESESLRKFIESASKASRSWSWSH